MSRTTLWRFLAVAMPVLGALAAQLPAVDLAYQLRAGAEILDTGVIPSVDSWTFTVAGTPWLDQQWGAQVLLELVFRLGGWTGLVVLRAALVGIAFGLLLLVVLQRAPALGPRATALIVIGAFVVSAVALALRPQLFAICLFAATLALLAVREARPRLVWLIPVIAVAWASLHGTFPLVLVLCGLAWLGDLADASPTHTDGLRRPSPGWLAAPHRMLLVGLVAGVGTVVTPFGASVWGYVANLATNPVIAGRVSEWQPPSPLTVPGALVWLSIALAAVALAWRTRRIRAIPWAAALTLLLFGAFAAISGRGTAWWPFVAVFVVAPWLAPAKVSEGAWADASTPPLLRRANASIVAALALAGLALLPPWRPVGAAGVPQGTLAYAPQGIASRLGAALDQLDVEPPVAIWNPQVWGSWLEYSAPDYRYAVDSRIELYPPGIWADADAVAAGDLGVLDRYEVDVVVTDRQAQDGLRAALARSSAWTELITCGDGSIWVRLADLRPTGIVMSSCL